MHWAKVATALLGIMLISACEPTDKRRATESDAVSAPALHLSALLKSPNDKREYASMTLANGLQVLLVSDPQAQQSAAALAIDVGSADDPDQQLGLAHYLEHMLLLGSEQFPQADSYSRFMAANGGLHNAVTSHDHTSYSLRVNHDALAEALSRFADLFIAPTFASQYAEKERHAVDAEWRLRRESDSYMMYALDAHLLNPKHPLSRFRIGNLETLSDKPDQSLQQALLTFYQQHYSAERMALTVISPLSLSQLRDLVAPRFSAIPERQTVATELTQTAITPAQQGLFIHYRPRIDKQMLFIDFPISDNSRDFKAKPNRYVTYLLNSEMPGTPAPMLRQQGLISQLSATAEPRFYHNSGRLRIAVELTDQGLAHYDQVIATLVSYLQLLRQTGPQQAYAEEIKTALQNQFRFLERQEPFQYATELSAKQLHLPLQHVLDADYNFSDFNPDAISGVLQQLTLERARIWLVAPSLAVDKHLPFYSAAYRQQPISNTQRQRWLTLAEQQQLQLPSVNQLLPEDFEIYYQPEKAQLKPVVEQANVSVWLSASHYMTQPRAELAIQLNSRLPYQSARHWLASQLLLLLFEQQQQALSDEARIAGVQFSVSVVNGILFRLSGFSDKQPLLATRLMTALQQVAINDASLLNVKQQLQQRIDNRDKAYPINRAAQQLSSLLKVPGWSDQQLLEQLTSIDVDDVRELQQQLLQHSQLRLLALGNLTAPRLRQLSLTLQQQLPAASAAASVFQQPVLTPSRAQQVSWQQRSSGDDNVMLDAYISLSDDITDHATTLLLSQLLSTPFYHQLRTEQQLGYVVGVEASRVGRRAMLYFYLQSPQASLAAVGQQFVEFYQQYGQRMARLQDAEFEQYRDNLLQQLQQQPQNLGEEFEPLLDDWLSAELPQRYQQRLIAAVQQLRKVDVQQAYQRLLLEQQGFRVLLQLRGQAQASSPWYKADGLTVLPNIEAFQQRLPRH
ncbi:Zn-dependent peptidase [Idiomarina xiamenensis 10-D-4]|uniref:Protease 3 n=2 Tax=Idiomarina xiamenensis TaxID=1207041 RepID=K2K4L6_9GAMM|nr:Zn-dependent peptidase [Idiomarina xiamenensis 10-D-4]